MLKGLALRFLTFFVGFWGVIIEDLSTTFEDFIAFDGEGIVCPVPGNLGTGAVIE